MFAVFSDVHANYEALEAVLNEIRRLGPDRVICLGDIVGYGPDPEKCIDAVRRASHAAVCGNHDYALIYGARGFNRIAGQSINYHRQRLMSRSDSSRQDDDRKARWEFLKGLPHRHEEGGFLFVHGSPRNPTTEYLRAIDVQWKLDRKIESNFGYVDWLCFVGHTHQAGVITDEMGYFPPADLDNVFRPQPHQRAIINVGSVGQPRDGDARACFVTVEEDGTTHFHRVEYDLEETISKISGSGAIDMSCAERLRSGQ